MMTPRWLCNCVVLLCALLQSDLAVAHRRSNARRRTPSDPATTRLTASDSPSAAPVITHRKCGHRPLPLTERRRRAGELGPVLKHIRQRQATAAGQPGRRRLRDGAAATVLIDVYWHYVALSGAPYRLAKDLKS